MHKLLSVTLICGFALAIAPPVQAGGVDAEAVFEQLKSLEGTWRGEPEAKGEEAEAEAETAGHAVHEFRVSAAGTVVMETMGPGTDHEMINMYHVDGDDLVLTHYCAGGNQPKMRLDREHSTAEKMVFDFAGGTNFDPAVDPHIHAAEIAIVGHDRIDSVWTSYSGGEPVGGMTFHLSRSVATRSQ